jgi:hypothetical protein
LCSTVTFCWPLPRWRFERVEQHGLSPGKLVGL